MLSFYEMDKKMKGPCLPGGWVNWPSNVVYVLYLFARLEEEIRETRNEPGSEILDAAGGSQRKEIHL